MKVQSVTITASNLIDSIKDKMKIHAASEGVMGPLQ